MAVTMSLSIQELLFHSQVCTSVIPVLLSQKRGLSRAWFALAGITSSGFKTLAIRHCATPGRVTAPMSDRSRVAPMRRRSTPGGPVSRAESRRRDALRETTSAYSNPCAARLAHSDAPPRRRGLSQDSVSTVPSKELSFSPPGLEFYTTTTLRLMDPASDVRKLGILGRL